MTQTPIEYVTGALPAEGVDNDKGRSWRESLQHDLTGGGFPVNANPRILTNFVVAKSGAGLLFGFTVYSSKATAQNVQVFDARAIADLTSGTTVPWLNFPINATQAITVGFSDPWRAFSRGIIVANSTTDTVWTQGLNDCLFDVQYA